jgi:hypothetical protein
MPDVAVEVQLGTEPLRHWGSGSFNRGGVLLQCRNEVLAERFDVKPRASARVVELRPSRGDLGLTSTQQSALMSLRSWGGGLVA